MAVREWAENRREQEAEGKPFRLGIHYRGDRVAITKQQAAMEEQEAKAALQVDGLKARKQQLQMNSSVPSSSPDPAGASRTQEKTSTVNRTGVSNWSL